MSLQQQEQEQQEQEQQEPIGNVGAKKNKKKNKNKNKNKKAAKVAWLPDDKINTSATNGERRFATHMPAKPDKISLPDKRLNRKYIDFLDDAVEAVGLEDKPFALIAMLAPETHLRRQECFRLEKWVQKWPFLTLTKSLEDFVAFVAHKYNISHNVLHQDFLNFMRTRASTLLEFGAEVDYDQFVDTFREDLDQEMKEKHGFQTQVRGLKLLGVFKDEKSAGDWVHKNLDLNNPEVKKMPYFIGLLPAGQWSALSPEIMRGESQPTEYLQEQLNHLMKHAHANANARQTEHERRVNEAKYNQFQQNVALAQATNQKVTQIVQPDGSVQKTLVHEGGQPVENLDDRTSAGTNVTATTAPTLMKDVASSVEMRSHTDPSFRLVGHKLSSSDF